MPLNVVDADVPMVDDPSLVAVVVPVILPVALTVLV